MEWTLKLIYQHFEDAVGELTITQLKDLDEKAYQQLLLEKAELLFSDGRYNTRTEWCLELFQLAEAESALHDLKQISELTNQERIKLKFFQDLKALCYPMFRQQDIDLSQPAFRFGNLDFNIMNPELREFLYESPYPHLSAVLCQCLASSYSRDEERKDTVITNQLTEEIFYGGTNRQEKDSTKFRESLDKLIDLIYTSENHLRVGKLLGLSAQAQAIYDMTDTFICKEYLYNQVAFAQEMSQWIEQNWEDDTPEERQQSIELLVKELDACAQKHDISFVDKSSTINQLVYDLLDCPFCDEDYQMEDDEFEDED